MDYCSTCRRHLNGALVCPGCGAYAPDIAPPLLTDRAGAGRSAESTAAEVSVPFDGDPGPEHDTGSAAGPSVDAAQVSSARPGRAARRRQLARLKKHQRRAMVATAFALVGGGLSLATLDRHTTGQAQAATAPDDRSMGAARERVEAEPPRQASQVPRAPRASQAPQAPERRAPHTAPERHAPVGVTPRHQTLPATPGTAAPVTRADSVPPHHPTVVPPPQQQTSGSASSGGTAGTNGPAPGHDDTATPPAPAPAPTTGGTDTGTSGTAPVPAATSPAQLCLLGLCLG
ncbi:SCO2400 family protein [Streptomyces sp. NPDC001811]